MKTILSFAALAASMQMNAATACQFQTVDYFAPPASQYDDYINQGGYRLSLCNAPHGPLPADTPCRRIDLKGYLYVPHPLPPPATSSAIPDMAYTNDRDLPLVIWVDGSFANSPDATVPSPATYPQGCGMLPTFAAHGYAALAVVRRGYQPSTGENADVFAATQPNDHTTNDLNDLQYLANQSFEVQQAINFMLRQKNRSGHRLIDPDKIAIAGHSIGGIVTLYFGNLGNHDPIIDAGVPSGRTQAKVKILFSPSEESWDAFDRDFSNTNDVAGSDGLLDDTSPALEVLKRAAQHSILPMYFLGPLNDANTRSVVVLAKAAGDWQLGADGGTLGNDPEPDYSLNRDCRLRIRADQSLSANQQTRKIVDTCPLPREVQSALFPAAPLSNDLDSNGDPVDPSGHGPFITDPAQIAKWTPSVLDFMARYGVTP